MGSGASDEIQKKRTGLTWVIFDRDHSDGFQRACCSNVMVRDKINRSDRILGGTERNADAGTDSGVSRTEAGDDWAKEETNDGRDGRENDEEDVRTDSEEVNVFGAPSYV